MEKNQVFVVVYIALSESDPDANGYSETKTFGHYDDAHKYMQLLVSNEISFCKDEEREYQILEDEEKKFHMAWNNQADQVIIKIEDQEVL
jgi:hypothetical protein